MLKFHHFLKGNEEFQRTTPRSRWEFPPQSTWLVFTDMVSHAVLSGQFALEQTFIVSRRSLVDTEKAPVSILERMAGCASNGELTHSELARPASHFSSNPRPRSQSISSFGPFTQCRVAQVQSHSMRPLLKNMQFRGHVRFVKRQIERHAIFGWNSGVLTGAE